MYTECYIYIIQTATYSRTHTDYFRLMSSVIIACKLTCCPGVCTVCKTCTVLYTVSVCHSVTSLFSNFFLFLSLTLWLSHCFDSNTTPGGRRPPLQHGTDSKRVGLSTCCVFMCVYSAPMALVHSKFLVGVDLWDSISLLLVVVTSLCRERREWWTCSCKLYLKQVSAQTGFFFLWILGQSEQFVSNVPSHVPLSCAHYIDLLSAGNTFVT